MNSRNEDSSTFECVFINNLVSGDDWIITDGADGSTVFEGYLAARDESGDRVTVSLTARHSNGSGDAFYRRQDAPTRNHVDNLSDGDEVRMN